MPITDIFAKRHGDAGEFLQNTNWWHCDRFFGQFHYMAVDEMQNSFPFFDTKFWNQEVYKKLVHEFGRDLYVDRNCYQDHSIIQCLMWLERDFGNDDWKLHASERLSLVELVFQGIRSYIERYAKEFGRLAEDGEPFNTYKKNFEHFIDALNIRLSESNIPLRYYNGRLEPSDDSFVAEYVEKPFWELVSGSRWKKASDNMKSALDQREKSASGAVLSAGKALESTLREISENSKWMMRKCIDNIEERGIISSYESKQIKIFVDNVRNENSHEEESSSKEELKTWTAEDVSYIIDYSMITIKNLIHRAK